MRAEQWCWPTPCAEWTVRELVNHMTRGNLNYRHLAEGGTGAEFLRLRDADALGADPVGAYVRSVREWLDETPVAARTTHRFFAAPRQDADHGASVQERLLRLMGRNPEHGLTSSGHVGLRASRPTAAD